MTVQESGSFEIWDKPSDFLKLSAVEIQAHMDGLDSWRAIDEFASPVLDHMYTYDSHEPKPGTPEAQAMATFLEALIVQVVKTNLERIKGSKSQSNAFKAWFQGFVSYVGGFVAPHLLSEARYKEFGDYYREAIRFLNNQSTAAPLPPVEYLDGVRVQKVKTGGGPSAPFHGDSLSDNGIRKTFDLTTGTFRTDIKIRKD